MDTAPADLLGTILKLLTAPGQMACGGNSISQGCRAGPGQAWVAKPQTLRKALETKLKLPRLPDKRWALWAAGTDRRCAHRQQPPPPYLALAAC